MHRGGLRRPSCQTEAVLNTMSWGSDTDLASFTIRDPLFVTFTLVVVQYGPEKGEQLFKAATRGDPAGVELACEEIPDLDGPDPPPGMTPLLGVSRRGLAEVTYTLLAASSSQTCNTETATGYLAEAVGV